MDTATLIAVLGFLGTLVASIIGAIVAISTNRTEKAQTAEQTVEKTLRERILLRDEQIEDLKDDVLEKDVALTAYRKTHPCKECILFSEVTGG